MIVMTDFGPSPLVLSEKNHNSLLRQINHQVRSQLNAAMTGLLLLQEDVSSESHPIIDVIKESVTAVSDILNDSLTLDQISRGQLKIELTEVDLGALLLEVVDHACLEAKRKNVRLQLFHYRPDESSLIQCDAGKIAQVIRNVLSNAVGSRSVDGFVGVFLMTSESKTRIDIYCRVPCYMLVFSMYVIDVMVVCRTERTMFNARDGVSHWRWVQIGSLSWSRVCALIRRLCRSMAGRWTSRSTDHLGVGYSISFFAPLHQPGARLPRTMSSVSLPPISKDKFAPHTARQLPRFLVVDDSRLCRKMIVAKLGRIGCTCVEAEDGSDAVVRFLAKRKLGEDFDCILMDNTMPGFDYESIIE